MQNVASIFLQSSIKRLSYYKELGDKTLAVLNTADFHFNPNEESNSIAVIIQHVSGNMLSRWTDFLTTDGEKEWRNRDTEFEIKEASKELLIELWEKGWTCCLSALNNLTINTSNEKIFSLFIGFCFRLFTCPVKKPR